jgi:UDP-2,3-diacylglucosamine diphosphatase
LILFVSDLHLAPQAPAVGRLFLAFLDGRARAAEHLFILGDLFEAWPGDDCLDDPEETFAAEIVGALGRLVAAGVGVSLLHGNRDFLLGERFAARSGVRLLPDPHVLSLPAWQFVLSHGDRVVYGRSRPISRFVRSFAARSGKPPFSPGHWQNVGQWRWRCARKASRPSVTRRST